MNWTCLCIAAAAVTTVVSPLAAAPCEKADAKLVGIYELTGVRETGSVIALAPDGRFEYMLTVGAFDEVARGCWQRSGETVTLTPQDIKTNSGDPTFKTLPLKLDKKGGLVRFYQGKRYGVYVRPKK